METPAVDVDDSGGHFPDNPVTHCQAQPPNGFGGSACTHRCTFADVCMRRSICMHTHNLLSPPFAFAFSCHVSLYAFCPFGKSSSAKRTSRSQRHESSSAIFHPLLELLPRPSHRRPPSQSCQLWRCERLLQLSNGGENAGSTLCGRGLCIVYWVG